MGEANKNDELYKNNIEQSMSLLKTKINRVESEDSLNKDPEICKPLLSISEFIAEKRETE